MRIICNYTQSLNTGISVLFYLSSKKLGTVSKKKKKAFLALLIVLYIHLLMEINFLVCFVVVFCLFCLFYKEKKIVQREMDSYYLSR